MRDMIIRELFNGSYDRLPNSTILFSTCYEDQEENTVDNNRRILYLSNVNHGDLNEFEIGDSLNSAVAIMKKDSLIFCLILDTSHETFSSNLSLLTITNDGTTIKHCRHQLMPMISDRLKLSIMMNNIIVDILEFKNDKIVIQTSDESDEDYTLYTFLTTTDDPKLNMTKSGNRNNIVFKDALLTINDVNGTVEYLLDDTDDNIENVELFQLPVPFNMSTTDYTFIQKQDSFAVIKLDYILIINLYRDEQGKIMHQPYYKVTNLLGSIFDYDDYSIYSYTTDKNTNKTSIEIGER